MRTVGCILLLVLGIATANAQPAFWEANRLIDEGWIALRDGEDAERMGDTWRARQAYEYASDAAGRSLVIGDQMGVPFYERPAGLFFLFGQTELHRAQLLDGLGAPLAEVDFSLDRARLAFNDTLQLVDYHFPPGSQEWTGRRSEALFALGAVYFLRGDLEAADRAMREIESLQPSLAAREVRSAINYTTGRQASRETPAGVILPERPQGSLSGERLVTYAVEIGKALFGRWGTIAGMLVEDVYTAAQ